MEPETETCQATNTSQSPIIRIVLNHSSRANASTQKNENKGINSGPLQEEALPSKMVMYIIYILLCGAYLYIYYSSNSTL